LIEDISEQKTKTGFVARVLNGPAS